MSKSFASLLSSFKSAPKQTETVSSESKSAKLEEKAVPSFSKPWGRVQEFLSAYNENSVGDEQYRRSTDTKEIALLFIIQKDLPNELLWRLWIERIESTNYRVRVWIHAKEPSAIQSRWIQDRLVRRFQLRPSWGSLELTKTMVCLLFEAYLDCPTTDMFVFASESCIPFSSATKVFNSLLSTSMVPSSSSASSSTPASSSGTTATPTAVVGLKSWLQYRDTPNNGYSRMQQFDVLKDKIPAEHILKSDQWVAICHAHARKLFQCLHYLSTPPQRSPASSSSSSATTTVSSIPSNNDSVSDPSSGSIGTNATATTANHDRFMRELTFGQIQNNVLFTLFHGMKASDEMFFATTLSMLQLRSEIEPRRWTYAEWEGQAASPLLFQAAELMKNLPSFEDLCASSSKSSSSSSSLTASSASSASASTDQMTTTTTMQYTLPAERRLHPNLRRAMTEDTFFLRKIRWESLTYYRDLPASASTYDRQQQSQPKEMREAQEIQALFAYGPVQASLNLVERWWLFVHRSELREILRTGRASIAVRPCDENVSDPRTALREYWQQYCVPIVENVLYFNRSRDEWHTPLDRLDEVKQEEAAEATAAAESEEARGKRPRLDLASPAESIGDGGGGSSGEENGGRNVNDGDVAHGDADDGDEPTDAKRARR